MGVDEIKKLLKTENLVFGAEKTIKALRNNELIKVFLASNAPEEMIKDIEYYSSIANVEFEKLDVPNDELGVVCKKPFSIVCIGMKKVIQKKKY